MSFVYDMYVSSNIIFWWLYLWFEFETVKLEYKRFFG